MVNQVSNSKLVDNKGYKTEYLTDGSGSYVMYKDIGKKGRFALFTPDGPNRFEMKLLDNDLLHRYLHPEEVMLPSLPLTEPVFKEQLQSAVANKKVQSAVNQLESTLAFKRRQYLVAALPQFNDRVYNVIRRVLKLIAFGILGGICGFPVVNAGTLFRERYLVALDQSHDSDYSVVIGDSKKVKEEKVKEDPVDACFKFLDEVAIPVQEAYKNACIELVSNSDENKKKDIVSRFFGMLAENGYDLELRREIFKLKNGSPNFEALSSEQKNTLKNMKAIRKLFPIQNAAAVKPDKISQMKEALEKSNKVSDFAMRVLKLIASQVVCGTVGGLLGTVFIPIPVVGTLLGIGIGLWIGQIIGHCLDKMQDSKKFDESSKFLNTFAMPIEEAHARLLPHARLLHNSDTGIVEDVRSIFLNILAANGYDLERVHEISKKISKIKEGSPEFNALTPKQQTTLLKFQKICSFLPA